MLVLSVPLRPSQRRGVQYVGEFGRRPDGRIPRDEFAPVKRFKAGGPRYRFGGNVATPAAPASPRRRSPGARLTAARARPPTFPAGRCFPLGAARPAACPGSSASLTSSLCVDGHFFRRRPQLSRFPVCRCRVLARASSAPAARLSVPMAAADGGGPGGYGAAGEEGGRPAGRGARGRRAEREAGRPTRRDLGLSSGPRVAGRWRSGGPGRKRWPRRLLLLLRPPPES